MIDHLCKKLQHCYRLRDGEIVTKQQGDLRVSQHATWRMSEKSIRKGLNMKRIWAFSVILLWAYWAATMPAYSTNLFDRGHDRGNNIFDRAPPATQGSIPERAKFAVDCIAIFYVAAERTKEGWTISDPTMRGLTSQDVVDFYVSEAEPYDGQPALRQHAGTIGPRFIQLSQRQIETFMQRCVDFVRSESGR